MSFARCMAPFQPKGPQHFICISVQYIVNDGIATTHSRTDFQSLSEIYHWHALNVKLLYASIEFHCIEYFGNVQMQISPHDNIENVSENGISLGASASCKTCSECKAF